MVNNDSSIRYYGACNSNDNDNNSKSGIYKT